MLNERQYLFCKEYLKDLNATQAAIRAGYSKKTARQIGDKLLTNIDIKTEVQKQMDERSKRVEIDSDYVLNTIRETVDRCRQVRPVLDREGNPVLVETPSGDITPAFTFEPNAVLKGCELLG